MSPFSMLPSIISGVVPMRMLPWQMRSAGSPRTMVPFSVSSTLEYSVLALDSMAVSKMSMFALAMSFTAIRPRRSFFSSVMHRVLVLRSRMRFHAEKSEVSASMLRCLEICVSLICGATLVMSSGSSKPKVLSANAVSRLMAPARRGSYSMSLIWFLRYAYAMAEQMLSVSGCR